LPKISEAQRLKRRGVLLEAAVAVFSTRGFANATIDDIAAEAKVSKGYVYTYFSSKDDIFLAVVREFDHVTGRWDILADTVAKTRGQPVEARLMALWEAVSAQWSPDNLQDVRLQLEIWAEASRNARLHEALIARSSRSLQFVETILQESGSDLDPEDHVTVARTWWALIDGLVLYWIAHGSAPSPQEIAHTRRVVERLWHRFFACPHEGR
jgi:AcrR family transcriptional regulator